MVYLKQSVKWLKHSQVTQRISDGVPETNSEVVEALTRITAGVPETTSEIVRGNSEDQ